MAVEEVIGETKGTVAQSSWNRGVGIYIAVLAVLLSIASMGGGNAAKDAAKANLDATNNWAFFQAKNLRRQHYIMAKDELELKLLEQPGMSPELRSAIDKKLAEYDGLIARHTSDKERNEGLDELWERGKKLEAIRDAALKRDPYFDYGQAFLQIAIVLASVAIITGGASAVILSAALGVLGALFTLNGFLMIADFMP